MLTQGATVKGILCFPHSFCKLLPKIEILKELFCNISVFQICQKAIWCSCREKIRHMGSCKQNSSLNAQVTWTTDRSHKDLPNKNEVLMTNTAEKWVDLMNFYMVHSQNIMKYKETWEIHWDPIKPLSLFSLQRI